VVPGGAVAYVCNFASDALPGTSITPVDLAHRSAGPRLSIGSLPSALAPTPDGRRLLVTAQGADQVVVVDTSSDSVAARLSTGLEPDAVAVTPDGATALVADFGDGTVTPVDLSTLRTRRPAPVGGQPDAVAVTPDGRTAVVADLAGASVSLLDLSTMQVRTRVAVGSEPDAVAVTPDGATALVANFGDGTVTPVDLSTGRAGPAVAVGSGPRAVVVSRSPGGPAAWSGWVAVGGSLVPLHPSTPGHAPTAGTTVAVGHIAEDVALAEHGTVAWVAGLDGAITPVDLATGVPGRSTHVAGRPSAIAVVTRPR